MARQRWRGGVVSIVVVVAFGCKDKPADAPVGKPADEPAQPAPDKPPPAPSAPAADAAPTVTAPTEPSCATPCLLLATTPLADAARSYQTMCGKAWPEVPASDCDQYDYERNCIYAANGHVFKKKRWKDEFAGQDWYKPDPAFKDSDLPANAAANVAELKKRAAACKKEHAVTPDDKKRVDAWIDTVLAGKPERPPVVVGNEPAEPADVRTWMFGDPPQVAERKHWQFRYLEVPDDVAKALPTAKLRAIQIDLDDPEAECEGDEECGSGVWLVLVYDDANKLAAMEIVLSACPLVFRIDGDRLRYEGELIRNLARPGAEMTRVLPVSRPSCTGTVRYRIREDKRETTWLDQVALDIDGDLVRPVECARGGAICANDGVRHRMDRGDWLDLSFAIPPGARCQRLSLRSNGHYVPLTE